MRNRTWMTLPPLPEKASITVDFLLVTAIAMYFAISSGVTEYQPAVRRYFTFVVHFDALVEPAVIVVPLVPELYVGDVGAVQFVVFGNIGFPFVKLAPL